MNKIIRSKEQIRALIEKLQQEYDTLPLYNIFGESNDESRMETKAWIDELQVALFNDKVIDEWSEVGYWLVNERGTLGSDYGV